MKLHISQVQLNELSEKGKKKLRKRWKPQLHDFIISKWQGNRVASLIQNLDYDASGNLIAIHTYNFPDLKKKHSLPLLSIGQMIEFSAEYHKGHHGVVILPFVKKFNKHYVDVVNPEEWCDALWEAVKEELERG